MQFTRTDSRLTTPDACNKLKNLSMMFLLTLRDHQIAEAKTVYTTFSDLPLEIVIDIRNFTVSVLSEPQPEKSNSQL
ncbi:hypothetical protein CUC50_04920 [Citrobacter werkmanii]|nr:hypothetical protein CUC50_04920 [Citrobacter werkmanii]